MARSSDSMRKATTTEINDAAMQALGSYRGGTMLFLGFGTGLGSAMVVEGVLVPMELGQLSFKNGTYEGYLGLRGLKRLGKKEWCKQVSYCMNRLVSAFYLDNVVLGGGNAKKLTKLPKGSRAGHNDNAFLGGFRCGTRRVEAHGMLVFPIVFVYG
jgi:predicted NBD/HSP70 family sugar kinase